MAYVLDPKDEYLGPCPISKDILHASGTSFWDDGSPWESDSPSEDDSVKYYEDFSERGKMSLVPIMKQNKAKDKRGIPLSIIDDVRSVLF